MLEALREWLNGSREYFAGVAIYSQLGDDQSLLELFVKGKTDYCNRRLQNELLDICQKIKRTETFESHTEIADKTIATSELPNSDLYALCKTEADKFYKEVMNLRAELFASARQDDYSDPNTPDRIEQRSKAAVKVASDYKRVSELYDRVDFVKLHGHLPGNVEPSDDELNPDGIPDSLVKQTLDNTRKNYNKMKKREATPERLALLQKHEGNIKKLEDRWRLLQPEK